MGTDYTNYWGTMWDSSWEWALKFAWFPAKMDSGKFVWCKKYHHGIRIIHGPGEPAILNRYLTLEEFTWEILSLGS